MIEQFSDAVVFDSNVMTLTNMCTGRGINASRFNIGAFHAVWTGTPVGNGVAGVTPAFLFDGSEDAATDPSLVTTWTPLTTPAGFSAAAAIPAGIAGSFIFEWWPLTPKWIRVRYSNSGGNGLLACRFTLKG
jgi:hypothetical protein